MRFSPNIELERNSDRTSDLRCPRCGGIHLHQTKVSIFNRQEDEETVFLVTVNGKNTSTGFVSNDESGNPSSRRQGLAIEFDCEGCSTGDPDDVLELTIAQHKGSTEMGWRFTPRKSGGPR